MQKHDGRVIDLGMPQIYRPHPEAMAFIEANLRREKTGGQPITFPNLYPSGRMLQLINMTRGGVIYDAEIAKRLGELLLETHCRDVVGDQHPPNVIDNGNYWQIDGSWRDRRTDAKRSISMSVRKYDARVADFRKSSAPC